MHFPTVLKVWEVNVQRHLKIPRLRSEPFLVHRYALAVFSPRENIQRALCEFLTKALFPFMRVPLS